MAVPDYKNGYVPENLLVIFRRGWNKTDGDWFHGYPPATYAKHLGLVKRAYARTGRTLALSEGWGAYRPMHAQVIARNAFGIGAATPGTSSHGGFWEGRQTMAGDYSNWAWVYENHGGRAAFAEDARAVGFWPDMITPARGYPDEPWHLVDPDPWGPVLAGTDFEEIDMTTVAEFFNTPVSKQPDGGDITLAQFMTETWRLSNMIYDQTPTRVWSQPLRHPIVGKDLPAGEFLRYEPAEHANTRAAVAKVAVGDVDYDRLVQELNAAYPQLDAYTLAVAAADEADRRERERLGSA